MKSKSPAQSARRARSRIATAAKRAAKRAADPAVQARRAEHLAKRAG